MNHKLCIAAFSCIFASCAIAEKSPWPDWVLDPTYEGGVAASECVTYSGSISMDRQQVSANARVALAQQISVRIKSMDKTYQTRVNDGKSQQITSSFESTSEQTVDTALNGARLKKVEVVNNTEGKFLCGLLALDAEGDKKLVHDVIRAKSVSIDTDTEEILLAKFRERAVASSK
jgi:hypothetical protein